MHCLINRVRPFGRSTLLEVLRSIIVPLLSFWLAAATAFASTADASRLIQAGQLDQAGRLIDAGLQANARDAQWRFLQAVWLAAGQRTDEAVAGYRALILDHPELPEPYNNLAVLQAAAGALPEARRSLEAALRADPSYGVAHQNLGDVFVRLAAQSYEQALALSPDNAALGLKLTQLRRLLDVQRQPEPLAQTLNR